MRAVVADAIAAGAAGFATSSSTTHSGDGGRPVPSRLADLRELNTLLEPLRDAGRGVAALLPGETIKHADVFDIQRAIGRPLTWTALLTIKNFPWHEKIMEANVAARAEGVEVWPQVSCRPLVFQMNLKEPFTFNMRPIFAALMDTTFEQRVAAYRDPSWRARAWDELNGAGVLPPNWASLTVAESSTHPELVGRPLPELAKERGCTPLDVMLDVSLSEALETRFTSVLANNDPDAIAWLLPQETVLLGLADSGAHVSQLCDACFATDLLGNWVRDRAVMPMERAIHKLTGEPAAVYGLTDRGTIAPGKAADITVFDPDTVAPGPLRRVHDFPAERRAARCRRARRPLAHARERRGDPGRRCGRQRGSGRAAGPRAPGLMAQESSPVDELVIRRATRADLRAIVALLADDAISVRRESVAPRAPTVAPEYERAFAAIDANPDELLVVACLGDEVVGTLQLTLLHHLNHRGVDARADRGVRIASSMRGRGLGHRLLEWTLARAVSAAPASRSSAPTRRVSTRTASTRPSGSAPRTRG